MDLFDLLGSLVFETLVFQGQSQGAKIPTLAQARPQSQQEPFQRPLW